MASQILDGLTAAQMEAVVCDRGPVLVVAGAGSGKTRVLTRKMAYLIEIGVSPYAMLAITFTNKAAQEMRERVTALVGDSGRSMWVSTFHSAALRMLRSHPEPVGYRPSFVVYDQSDARRLMEYVIRDMGYDTKRFSPRGVLSIVSQAKSLSLTPKEYEGKAMGQYEKTIAKLYTAYQDRLLSCNALDFDDILIKTYELLHENPEIASYYQRKFDYVLVDEFQDTNEVQSRLVEILAKPDDNVFVVGDSDQSIYAFRGAQVSNILEFESRYVGAKVVVLEENFRSTQAILDVANASISRNRSRYSKNLFSSKGIGDKVKVVKASSDLEEANFVASEILSMTSTGSASFRDFAVFYRANSQSRAVEEILMQRGVPFQVVGGVPFYERREIKDVISYLRLISNHNDEVSLKRVINVPKRQIGDATLSKISEMQRDLGVSLYETLSLAEAAGVSKRTCKQIDAFVQIIRQGSDQIVEEETPLGILDFVLEASNYLEMLKADTSHEGVGRLENIEELRRVVDEYASLQSFLENAALHSAVDDLDDSSKVTIMTLHGAKGLEFDTVFMLGLEDGLFPHLRSLIDSNGVEEERRLFYVGVTRARRRLYLVHAKTRRSFGETTYNPPSRFLEEISDELYDTVDLGDFGTVTQSYGDASNRRDLGRNYQFQGRTKGFEASISQASPGEVVFHRKWGEGLVLERIGTGEKAEVVVNFEEVGEKRLLALYANLKVIGKAR